MEHGGDVIELLDTLYSMISEAWGVPLGNDKCIIEREKALDIINEIKAAMPSALAEAKRLVAARDEFIGNAKKEAEALRKSSEEKARSLIEEQEIIRIARSRSAAWPRCSPSKKPRASTVLFIFLCSNLKKTFQDAQLAVLPS